ncbi:MAG TPA: formylglycine-generating enzyme family protein [Steroidobacteraceae bacterium]|nr:formylglycine-generating enzyme family protein [Steroidobacteraceae bacterium]
MRTRPYIAFAMLVLAGATSAAPAPSAAPVPAATFETVLPPAPGTKTATVAAFRMDRLPVTNADFARFVAAHPRWRRDRVARVFADEAYLQHWAEAGTPAAGSERQPVTRVSWFAANAYCEARGARLPTWYEWEWVAAAGKDRADARDDPQWRQRILDWYARPASGALPEVGRGEPNYYGIRDIHGLVWEWVQDLGSMLVSSDNREQGDPDTDRFCGSGALTFEQKENYAMLMRIATLSSMKAGYTSGSMGFRCVTDGARP